jgi:hypothetical protein
VLGLLQVFAIALVRNMFGNVVPEVGLAGDPGFVVIAFKVDVHNVCKPLDKSCPSQLLRVILGGEADTINHYVGINQG